METVKAMEAMGARKAARAKRSNIKLNQVDTIRGLASRGLLDVGDVLEHVKYDNVLRRNFMTGVVYSTASDRVRVRRMDGPGWATELEDAAEEPNRNPRGHPVFGCACNAKSDGATGPDETFAIVRA